MKIDNEGKDKRINFRKAQIIFNVTNHSAYIYCRKER